MRRVQHPQGMFERTGNIWRAQGRRARLELKHYRRHLMTEVLLNPDDIEGWRGTIHDGEVVESHEDAIARREDKERLGQPGARQARDDRTDEAAESGAAESSGAAAAQGEESEEQNEEHDGRQERGERGEKAAPVDQEEREEDEGTAEESGNGRAARAREDRPGRDRRPARTRLADAERPESAGNGRQRAGAARRGDSR